MENVSKEELISILKGYEKEIESMAIEIDTLKKDAQERKEDKRPEEVVSQFTSESQPSTTPLIDVTSTDVTELQNMVKSLIAEKNVLVESTRQQQEQIKKYEDIVVKLDEEKKKIEKNMEQMKSESNMLQQKVQSLQLILDSFKKEDPTHSFDTDALRHINYTTMPTDELCHLVELMRIELDSSTKSNTQLKVKLSSLEKSMDEIVAQKVLHERDQLSIAENKIISLTQRLSDEIEKNNTLEIQKLKLSQEIDELNNWKVLYEKQHGMIEITKYTKKLKDDNRRLSIALDQMTSQLSITIDMNQMLSQSFERLKLETGKPADFMYSEYEIHKEYSSNNMKLQTQIKVLEDQILSLETDNSKLRKTIKDQLVNITSDGFQYYGMTPEQLYQINEFAKNLIHGHIILPLDDRSRILLQENRQMKEDIHIIEMKLYKYEKEFGVLNTIDSSSSSLLAGGDSNVNGNKTLLYLEEGLKQDVQRLVRENTELNNRLTSLQYTITNDPMVLPVIGQDASAVSDIRHSEVYGSKASMKPMNVNTSTTNHSNVSGVRQSVPYSSSAAPSGMMEPLTARGKLYYQQQLIQLNLPPEEWTKDIKKIYGQFIHCLEDLYEKEEELDENHKIIDNLQTTLLDIKQHNSALYYDYILKYNTWIMRETQYKQQQEELMTENDDIKKKLIRIQDVIDIIQNDENATMEIKLIELNRKLIIYEVNESILSRKYTSLHNSYEEEQKKRIKLETDFIEMETTLKKRILYLEQIKNQILSQIGLLQTRIFKSVPVEDYQKIVNELELLREDHLVILKREVESRMNILQMQDHSQELLTLKAHNLDLQLKIQTLQQQLVTIEEQLQHEHLISEQLAITIQQMKSSRGSSSSSTSSTLLSAGLGGKKEKEVEETVDMLVKSMATYRGEASRLEVELASAHRKITSLQSQYDDIYGQYLQVSHQIKEMKSYETEIHEKDMKTRSLINEIKSIYEGGYTKEEADNMEELVKKITQEKENIQQECQRYKELAEIASMQAQSMNYFKQDYIQDITALQELCNKLESRNDDDLLIGKLQRQLISTKASYRSFTRKYQLLRGNIRQKELALRALEAQLDRKEQLITNLQDSHRQEVSSLKRALRNLTEMVFDTRGTSNKSGVAVPYNVEDLDYTSSTSHGLARSPSLQLLKMKTDDVMALNVKLTTVSQKVEELSSQAQNALNRLNLAETESNKLKLHIEELNTEKQLMSQRCHDLEILIQQTSNTKKSKFISTRIMNLTDELKSTKLLSLQQKRQIMSLNQEKRHLQNIIHQMENNVEDLEQRNVDADLGVHETTTANLLEQHEYNNEYNIDEYNMVHIDNNDNDDDNNNNNGENDDDRYNRVYPRDLVGEIWQQKRPFHPPPSTQSHISAAAAAVRLSTDDTILMIEKGRNPTTLTNEECLQRIHILSQQLMTHRKDTSTMKLQFDDVIQKNQELENLVYQQRNQLDYCDRFFIQHGYPPLSHPSSTTTTGGGDYIELAVGNGNNNNNNNNNNGYHHIEKEKLQQAASATIQSLQSIITEKNTLIDKYRIKIEDLNRDLKSKNKSKIDIKTDELLAELKSNFKGRLSNEDSDELGPHGSKESRLQEKLLNQIDEADTLIKDKNHQIHELETKLATQELQRERAEIRCGTALQEIEAMKGDMVVLVDRLKISEDKYNKLLHDYHHITTTTTANRHRESSMSESKVNESTMRTSRQQQQWRDEEDRKRRHDENDGNENNMEREEHKRGEEFKENRNEEHKYNDDTVSDGYHSDEDDDDNSKIDPTLNITTATTTTTGLPNVNVKVLNQQINRMKKQLKTKDDQLKKYQDMILKLKEEFIKNEEKYAVSQLNSNVLSSDESTSGSGSGSRSGEGLKDLRAQVLQLREGLREAKDEVEKTKKNKAKLIQAKQTALEEVRKISSQLSRVEAQASSYQDTLLKTRRELEESKKKESRLREKLKSVMGGNTDIDGGVGGGMIESPKGINSNKMTEKGAQMLQQENQRLKTRISRLYSKIESWRKQYDIPIDNDDDEEEEDIDMYDGDKYDIENKVMSSNYSTPMRKGTTSTVTSANKKRKSGYVLGEDISQQEDGDGMELLLKGAPGGDKGLLDYRLNMQKKWENEKKLQKRLQVMENRLKEKINENNDLLVQLKHTKDVAQNAISNKDEISKKMSAVTKLTQESRKLTLEDLIAIEEAQSQMFEVESENKQLKRKIEVDLATELMELRRKLSLTEAELSELRTTTTATTESQRKERHNTDSATTTGNTTTTGQSLREAEARYHMEEKLKDDIIRLKKQKIELESGLLTRDSKILEYKFELETNKEENQRLYRRIQELQAAYSSAMNMLEKSSQQIVQGPSGRRTTTSAPQQQPFQGQSMYGGGGSSSDNSYMSPMAPSTSNIPMTSGGNTNNSNLSLLKNRSKREQELEGVIEAMKKVIDKIRNENDRLRRGGVQEDERKIIEIEKKYNQEKKKTDKLEKEIHELHMKVKEFDNISLKITQKDTLITSLKKQIKVKENEVMKWNQQYSQLEADYHHTQDAVLSHEAKIEQLEIQLTHAKSDKQNNISSQLKAMETQMETTIQNLTHQYEQDLDTCKSDVLKLQQENTRLRNQLTENYAKIELLQNTYDTLRHTTTHPPTTNSSSSSGGVGSSSTAHSDELLRLQEENNKLKTELSAFDMDFFEEIENLKYAYSEAMKKIKAYESGSERKVQ